MSLMQEWVKLFPNSNPRSNANEVAGSSDAFPNFTAILNNARGSNDWAYDDWDEVTQYHSKGMEGELAWMGGKFSNAQWADYGTRAMEAPGLHHNTAATAPAVLPSPYSENESTKSDHITSSSKQTLSLTKQTKLFRALGFDQVNAGWHASIEGLKEYGDYTGGTAGDGLTLAEFKAL